MATRPPPVIPAKAGIQGFLEFSSRAHHSSPAPNTTVDSGPSTILVIIMFRGLGILLALYVCHAVAQGAVWAKDGIRAREVLRKETPRYFWAVVVIYAGLSLALIFVF